MSKKLERLMNQRQGLKALMHQTHKIIMLMEEAQKVRSKACQIIEKMPNVDSLIDDPWPIYDWMDDGVSVYKDMISEIESVIWDIEDQINGIKDKEDMKQWLKKQKQKKQTIKTC